MLLFSGFQVRIIDNQLLQFYLLFFFAHLIFSALGLFYLFFTFLHFFICFDESLLKMMKNPFYFIFFRFQDIQIFVLNFFVHVEKRLCQKDKVNFKIYDNLVNKQLQCKYCSISHEVKATRQFYQVIQINIFLQKSYRK